MTLIDIYRALGVALLVIAAAHLAPIFVGLTVTNEDVSPYLFGGLITALVGAALTIIGRAEERRSGVREAILFVFVWWLTAPAFAALPFVVSGLSVGASYFEAVSALTTTGAWLDEASARASGAGMIWRAVLQWIGGLASMAIAAAVFLQPIFVGVDTVPPQFARREDNSYFSAIEGALAYLWPPYVLVTLAAFLLLIAIADQNFLSAAVTALSASSSGGFFVDSGTDSATSREISTLLSGVLLPFVFLSGINLALVARFSGGKSASILEREAGAYAAVIFILTGIFWVFAAGGLAAAPKFFFNAASLMSTNGVVIGENVNFPMALVAVVIGGSAISTAGGLKILRWLVLFRRFREELRRLVMPNAVFGRPFVGNELGVWMHFLGFAFILGVLMLLLTAGGHSFSVSVAAAAGVMSNAGPIIYLADIGADGYQIFENPALQGLLIVGMILGRIEVVAALALMNISFWRA